MTTEIEKQFFDTFGIEPKLDCKRCGAMAFALGQCLEVNCEKTYPQITDRILLELIRIISSIHIGTQDRETLKEYILVQCINTQMHDKDIKQQVRTLFEEIENE